MFRAVALLLAMIVLCMAAEARAQNAESSPETVFDFMWETFDRHYALSEAKSIDWHALRDVYRPRASSATSDEELFAVLTGMLSHLDDTHVILQATSLGRDYSAGLLGPYVAEQIGYIHFHGFNDIAASAAAVDSILTALEGAQALIVDVRSNSGGDDRVGKIIADRFADRRRLYMVTRDRNGPGHGDFAGPLYWHLEPATRALYGSTTLRATRASSVRSRRK